MPRMIAAILRHGDYHQLPDTPSAHQPFPLTELGMQQAREAAAGLREVLDANNWELFPNLDCSRLLRAWQTARIIADELNDRIPGTPELGLKMMSTRTG
ncbi:MAG: phosphoglycerate mutase family protein, partial [Gammaproteobacteria bacterium]